MPLLLDPDVLEILLVENSAAEIRLAESAFQHIQRPYNLHVVRTEAEALQFLLRRDTFTGAPVPHLIVLDWNLPGTLPGELLQTIKNNPALQPIPVIVLSSSDDDENVLLAYQLRASCWVERSSNAVEQGRRFKSLIEFWCRSAQFPRAERRFKPHRT